MDFGQKILGHPIMGHTMIGHPSRQELAGYAECLADGRPISAAIGAHVSTCAQCAAEVKAVRSSFEFTATLPELEPTTELTTRILLEARAKRGEAQRERRGWASPLWFATRAAACAASVALVSFFSFGAFLSMPVHGAGGPAASRGADPAAAAASQEALRRAVDQVKALSTAVASSAGNPSDARELERRRAAQAMAEDIAAAKVALDRNPYCLRAADLFQASLQRQAETLRQLYIDRSL